VYTEIHLFYRTISKFNMKAYPKCVIPTPPDGVVDWGASNKAPQTFGNVFENEKAVGDDTLANPGWLPPGVPGSCPFVAIIRRVSDINGQVADPKFVLRRRDLHAPGGHSYLPPLKLIGIPAFFSLTKFP
jgi:hypothetical protein